LRRERDAVKQEQAFLMEQSPFAADRARIAAARAM
jgi:hypothetical protein